MIQTFASAPFEGQKPSTSGLCKKDRVFQQPDYTENFVQSVFDDVERPEAAALVLGGNGRTHNQSVIRETIRMAAAKGWIVGGGGILSTPAASHVIRNYGASDGLILSASHDPGGPKEDFGIKDHIANGGPATEAETTEMLRSLTAAAEDIIQACLHTGRMAPDVAI